MHLILFGESGAAWWLCSHAMRAKLRRNSGAILDDDHPNKASCTYLLSQFPGIARPVHCLSSQKTRGAGTLWKAHLSSYEYPPNSFHQIGNGLHVPCPELCFVQACTTTSVHRALKIGAALCSSFLVSPAAPLGLLSRQPLTTPARIQKFIARIPHLRGTKKAARLLPYLPSKAASPPETFLFLALTLPSPWGGYHLPPPLLNHRIKSGQRAQSIAQRRSLVPDLYWPQAKLALEFDSDTVHLNSTQAMRDSTKRLAFESSGRRTITVTTNQLASRDRMNHIAQQLARSLGCTLRIRSQNFPRQQMALFAEGWSLNWLFDPSWLEKPMTP